MSYASESDNPIEFYLLYIGPSVVVSNYSKILESSIILSEVFPILSLYLKPLSAFLNSSPP
jgi:hypothetical protein